MQNIGDYLQNIVKLSFWTNTEANGTSAWQSSWTAFYWGWWIAWAPFVGMFIARISKGRTIREFVLGVLLVPSLLGMFWLTVFGGTAMNLELFGGGGVVAAPNHYARFPAGQDRQGRVDPAHLHLLHHLQ